VQVIRPITIATPVIPVAAFILPAVLGTHIVLRLQVFLTPILIVFNLHPVTTIITTIRQETIHITTTEGVTPFRVTQTAINLIGDMVITIKIMSFPGGTRIVMENIQVIGSTANPEIITSAENTDSTGNTKGMVNTIQHQSVILTIKSEGLDAIGGTRLKHETNRGIVTPISTESMHKSDTITGRVEKVVRMIFIGNRHRT